MKVLLPVIVCVLFLAPCVIADETRIMMDCYINGQPVKMAFDTGAEGPVLFNQTADRLKLSIVKETPDVIKIEPGKFKLRLTEKCTFQFAKDGPKSSIQFAVVDIPSYMEMDTEGLIGFGGMKHMMFELNPSMQRLKVRETLDFDKFQWKCLDIRTDLNILVAKTSNDDEKQDLLLIDTGDPQGLTVKKELWQQLAGGEADLNTTLSAMYLPSVGLMVDRERWFKEIDFGELLLQNMPTRMGFETIQALGDLGVDGILGMWGLSCYTWIVDGPAGKIYYKENDLIRRPQEYQYNRLGAVFVPENIQTTNALVAHVIEDSPACAAGIRDGDELLRIGQLDATKWRTDPNVMPLSQYWEKPAGTIIELVLLRNGEEKKIAVRLKEIFE